MNAVTQPPLIRQLADLRDEISRLLPAYDAALWLTKFDDAAVDAEQCRVWDRFSRWLLLDDDLGVIQYAKTDEQRSLITRAAIGRTVDYNVIFNAAVSAATGGYAAAYSPNPAAIYKAAYPVAYALYTAAHASADRADLAVNAHATAHFAAGRIDAVQAQAEQLLELMRSES